MLITGGRSLMFVIVILTRAAASLEAVSVTIPEKTTGVGTLSKSIGLATKMMPD